MQKKVLLITAILLVSAISSAMLVAQNQPQNNASCNVFAKILPAYSAVASSQLSFGDFSPGAKGGKLTIAPQGTLSVKGSIVTKKEFHNSASYYVIGDNSTVFSVSLPHQPIELVNTSDVNTLWVSNWESAMISHAESNVNNGIQTVYVGATLEVGSSTDNPKGVYTGRYTITFDFN